MYHNVSEVKRINTVHKNNNLDLSKVNNLLTKGWTIISATMKDETNTNYAATFVLLGKLKTGTLQ